MNRIRGKLDKSAVVSSRRIVLEGSLAQIKANRASITAKSSKEAREYSIRSEVKDAAVGRRKAAVDRHQHLHRLQVTRKANHVVSLPLALVYLPLSLMPFGLA